MAQTKTSNVVTVKFAVMDYHYKTHKPQGFITCGPYKTAKKAASEFAYHVAMDFSYRYPKKFKRPRVKPGQIVITMVWDSPFWQIRYDKAYRRAFKIFKTMGMK